MELETRIRTALRDLGDTPGEVADSLRQRGVSGELRQVRHCPIANFVRTLITDDVHDVHVHTGPYTVRVRVSLGGTLIEEAFFDTPEVIEEFMGRFDTRAYPELIG